MDHDLGWGSMSILYGGVPCLRRKNGEKLQDTKIGLLMIDKLSN
jgi:hypothetical protein